MIKLLLFDLDDTLWPSSYYAEFARRNAVKAMIELGLDFDEDFLYEKLLEVIRDLGSNAPNHFNELLRRLGIKEEAKLIAAGVVAYHNSKIAIRPFPEVPRVLRILKEKGYMLGIVTNGLAVKQWDKIIRNELHHFIDRAIISEEVGYEKPDPRLLEYALNVFDCRPEESVMIGDRERDIKPAKELGMLTVRVKRGKYVNEVVDADYEINNLLELIEILRREDPWRWK